MYSVGNYWTRNTTKMGLSAKKKRQDEGNTDSSKGESKGNVGIMEEKPRLKSVQQSE